VQEPSDEALPPPPLNEPVAAVMNHPSDVETGITYEPSPSAELIVPVPPSV